MMPKFSRSVGVDVLQCSGGLFLMLQDPVRLIHHCKLKGYWFASSPDGDRYSGG